VRSHALTATVAAWLGLPTLFETHEPLRGLLAIFSLRTFVKSRGYLKVVTISESLREILAKSLSNAMDKDIVVCPDGVDVERYRGLDDVGTAQERLGLRPSGIVLGYAGHFYRGRGIQLIFQLARHFHEDTFLLIGGNDGDRRLLEQEAQAQGLENVKFLGFIPNANLPRYLAACDVLLMPYQRRVARHGGGDTSSWMSPLKMFEYMAVGRVIVSSDLPVLREVINDQNAILCHPEDIRAWFEAIHRVKGQKPWADKLARQAFDDALKYSWKNRAESILKLALG
jgi:glycosyltransferase involved in cell wall biosynthesis